MSPLPKDALCRAFRYSIVLFVFADYHTFVPDKIDVTAQIHDWGFSVKDIAELSYDNLVLFLIEQVHCLNMF